jgi:PAS domain S-box-containing protein
MQLSGPIPNCTRLSQLGPAVVRRSPVLRYGLAVIAVASSAAVGLLLRPATYETPYLLFYPAVLVSVWLGGLGAGLLATALSAAIADYLFIRPYHTLLSTASDILRAAYFCASFGLICWLIERRRYRTESQIDRQLQLLEMSYDPIIVRDGQGRITFWNGGAERLYGWTKEEALGQVTHSLLRTAFPCALEKIVAELQRDGRWEGEIVHTRKDRTRVIVASRWTLQQKSGFPAAVLEANFDLTQRKQNDEARNALFRSEKLAAAGRLAATIAHEINNPLGAATNLVYIASSDPSLPAHLRSHLRLANTELRRIAQISRQTLGYYRENSTPKSISITELLDDVLDLLAKNMERHQIRVERQYGDDVRVTGNEGELRQVFVNLIANAVEALAQGGTIKVRAAGTTRSVNDARSRIRVTIADNGPGIDPQARLHIFEPFFTTKPNSGTGLGLWVAQQIVQKYHGYVRLRSRYGQPGSGTAFSVVLPAEQSGLEEPERRSFRASAH